MILIANSDAGKLNVRNVFYRYVNVSVTLIINDDSIGDLIDEQRYSNDNHQKPENPNNKVRYVKTHNVQKLYQNSAKFCKTVSRGEKLEIPVNK